MLNRRKNGLYNLFLRPSAASVPAVSLIAAACYSTPRRMPVGETAWTGAHSWSCYNGSQGKDFAQGKMNFSTVLALARNKHYATNPMRGSDTPMHPLRNGLSHNFASDQSTARAQRVKMLTPTDPIFAPTNSGTASHHWLTPSAGSAARVISMHGLVLRPPLSVALFERSAGSPKVDLGRARNSRFRRRLSSASPEGSQHWLLCGECKRGRSQAELGRLSALLLVTLN
jgi:hypothetical protein